MRLLILSPYPEEGASFRFRILQYLPRLAAEGIECTVARFLNSAEFALVHESGRPVAKLRALWRGTGRLRRVLERRGEFDAVLVHRQLHPLGLRTCEGWLRRMDRPVILDVDDAVYLPQPHGNPWLQRLGAARHVRRLASLSRLVIVSNAYLGEWFSRHAPQVRVIPTTVDTQRFRPVIPAARPVPVIGWIGSPSTAAYLEALRPVWRRLRERGVFRLRIIGAGRPCGVDGVPVEERPWRLASEVEDFQSLDIGVYPLPQDAWALGKGGFKTIQYMAVGVPVVASPVGVNREIIAHGRNGFLAPDENAWVEGLARLVEDTGLRRGLGAAGRATVVERYSTDAQASQLVAALRAVTGAGATPGPQPMRPVADEALSAPGTS
jgi:glycosyltransferase involved in cell wall biosynthesis